MPAYENTEVVLQFREPGRGGSYEEIAWYKDRTGRYADKIVSLSPSINGGKPQYYNKYCSGSGQCDTSSKVELNVDNGELTIYDVNMSDEGFYYYNFYIRGGSADTGDKYEIELEVYGKSRQNLHENKKILKLLS